MAENSQLVKRCVMSAASLKDEKQSNIDFTQGTGKGAHKLFFICGSTQGYVSDKAQAIIKDTSLSKEEKLSRLEYAEIQMINEESGEVKWLPFLYPRVEKKILEGLSL